MIQTILPAINIANSWNQVAADFYRVSEPVFGGKRLSWGPYGPFEDEIKSLPMDLQGKRVLVAGCGSGPDVAYLAKQGARVIGLDFSEAQLPHARQRCVEPGDAA